MRNIKCLSIYCFDIFFTFPKCYIILFIFSPQTYAWHGGAQLASDPKFSSMVVTKQQYEEYGHSICADKFHV